MEAVDEGALAFVSSIFSLMPDFLTSRLRPRRLVVLPHESYLAYTQSRCGKGRTTLRSILVVFATDNSGPEALADILAALPHAAKVDCTDGVKELRRLRDE